MSTPGIQSADALRAAATRSCTYLILRRCGVCSVGYFEDGRELLDHEWICRRSRSTATSANISQTMTSTSPPAPLQAPPSLIPPSLAGFRFDSDNNLILPMPLPPVAGQPVAQVTHPYPYTSEGWSGTLPGPATPPVAESTS
ncbi:hypothetical protein EXIGLDRAFT_779355 [Exidia glandulosa HHB12029]|uniref:Uncharacterized protein n=1 Tax=Exidia glandulosa HHB12029 TaxID=1314781 RepID=A0A165C3Y1_EXIGL|nr:hypothetical protein EXIGLDRAFT_779355 [Exidia glandulosa HHB12029]